MALNGLLRGASYCTRVSGKLLATQRSLLQDTALGNDAILSDIDARTCSTTRSIHPCQQHKVATDIKACLRVNTIDFQKCLLGQPNFTVK
jgi:hypothetical protein